ncbi:hypothetical protein BH23GEM3_BH23GEM3_00630 [soil metagenome]
MDTIAVTLRCTAVLSMTPDQGMIPAVQVLETKLFIPRLRAGLVSRGRLTDRVRDGADRKLIVVSAPAGSGKTTLLAEWLSQRSSTDPPAGWLSLDAGDNDPALFWAGFIRALQKVEPQVGQAARAALEAGSAPTVALMTGLLNEIVASDCDFLLVLDDYHVIEAPAVHTSLSFFLDHLPPRMHVVIATRADPLLPLPRMRARGEVVELRPTDLRFTAEETAAFLNHVMTLELTTADVTALEQRTEGWIAGLKLAALSLQAHDDVRGVIDAFSGDNRYIADYLVAEVLSGLPDDTRRFLLDTSILERLDGALCDAVTGDGGSQAMLERLEKGNLFVFLEQML